MGQEDQEQLGGMAWHGEVTIMVWLSDIGVNLSILCTMHLAPVVLRTSRQHIRGTVQALWQTFTHGWRHLALRVSGTFIKPA